MQLKHLRDLDITGKRVLIREDLNVPVAQGRVTSDVRIRAALPTLELAVERGATVMVMSHLGRPEEGVSLDAQKDASLGPVAEAIRLLSSLNVRLVDDYLEGYTSGDEDIALFENVRINPGEKANDERLARKLAALCDVFVMDAFGTAHRAHASTEGVARFAPVACSGPLLSAELEALSKVLDSPETPLCAIVGGSKVSTKLSVLTALAEKVDTLIVGGGIANTFLAAKGFEVGRSLMEADLLDEARGILARVAVLLPTDVVVALELDAGAGATVRPVGDVADDEMILDIGPQSAAALCELVDGAGTILWNGPVGVSEIEQFASGTKALSEAIAASGAFSVAGGGDTLAAIDRFGVADRISYISTGGGAFLEFVEGRELPAVAALSTRAAGTD